VDASRPRVTLIARDLHDPARELPLLRSAATVAGGPPPMWISEYVADIFGWQLGHTVQLPIAGARHPFQVAGVWRDYARQNGAILIERRLYSHLSADTVASDAALWLAAGVDAGAAAESARKALPGGELFEIAGPGEIRRRSLTIFDRTFAVTYAMEAVAIVIGLAALSATFAARALARRGEFGMLRHIGFSRAGIIAMLTLEGTVLAAMAALAGLALGGVISVLLIHVVNRQSFHWGMEMHLPLGELGVFLCALLAVAALTAAISARQAASGDVVRAVREDW
jgi:putative ABC transport system permease protein